MRNRSFLHKLGPIRRAVDHEVSRQLAPTVRSAREAQETHRKALAERDRLVADLRENNQELRRRVAEVEGENRDLRAELARLQEQQRRREEREAEPRRQAQQAEERRQREREAEQRWRAAGGADAEIGSDLYCCLDCSSLWLLTTWPDRNQTVRRPVGPGCRTCAGQPLRELPAVKASLADAADEVTRPVTEAPEPAQRVDTAKFVADLLEHDPNAAVARAVARECAEFARTRLNRVTPPGHDCAWLNAIANGIDQIPKAVSGRIAWCATEILGLPEFPAKVLGEVVTRTALEPVRLKAIARGIRLVGAASCEGGKHLGDCPCARHLAIKDIAEPAAADKLTEALDNATRSPTVDEPRRRPPAPPPPPDSPPPPGRRIRGPGGGII